MCGVSASLWLHSQGCGVTAAPFCLGHTDVKQFHVPQLYLLAGCKEGQGVGKTFLCDEADVQGALWKPVICREISEYENGPSQMGIINKWLHASEAWKERKKVANDIVSP